MEVWGGLLPGAVNQISRIFFKVPNLRMGEVGFA